MTIKDDGQEIIVTGYRRMWRKGGPYRTSLTIFIPISPAPRFSWEIVWLIEPSKRGARGKVKQAEQWRQEQLAKAISYTSVMFLGYPAGYDIRPSLTLREARRIRRRMLAEYAGTNHGRGVVIYAVTKDNATIFVE